jgi:hypothetical protein
MRLKTAAGLASTVAGLGCLVAAGYEGLHYSAWADPGALGGMLRWGGAALVFFAVPAALAVIWFARELHREAGKLGLSPAQAAMIQLAVMEAAHREWSRYNQEWSEELTQSVMGPVRDHKQ